MNLVSLIGTVHKEMDRASVAELLKILMHIQPKVIFLEVPPDAMSDHFENCSRQNLESLAVRRYLDTHRAKLHPVDLPTPEREFFEDHAQLNMRIQDESAACRQLLQADNHYVRTYGFAYLNSEYNNKLWFDVYAEMSNTIHRLGDARLVEIHQSWKKQMELRDIEMMTGIFEYCSQHTFERGAFLVGAAHRQRIIELALEQSSTNSARIQWEFPSCQFA